MHTTTPSASIGKYSLEMMSRQVLPKPPAARMYVVVGDAIPMNQPAGGTKVARVPQGWVTDPTLARFTFTKEQGQDGGGGGNYCIIEDRRNLFRGSFAPWNTDLEACWLWTNTKRSLLKKKKSLGKKKLTLG